MADNNWTLFPDADLTAIHGALVIAIANLDGDDKNPDHQFLTTFKRLAVEAVYEVALRVAYRAEDHNQNLAGRTFVIGSNGESIRCLVCGMTSYHPHDLRHRYCGNCHKFHAEMREEKMREEEPEETKMSEDKDPIDPSEKDPIDTMDYLAAAHAMQSGVAAMMHRDARQTDPKHLRVGVNSAQVTGDAIVTLLIAKGVFTEQEYADAVTAAMRKEAKRYQEELSDQLGAKVTLA